MFDVIAFDADDTLWHNEHLYRDTQRQVVEILLEYHDAAWIESRMYETEIRNLEHYGYGMKGFTLSMIETAIDLSEGRIKGSEIRRIIELAQEVLGAPVQLLDGVAETIARLSGSHTLMLITKGDLFEQEAKIIRSGLADHFSKIEIVRAKIPDTYRALTRKYDIDPARFLMVGNSLRSDILPVIAIGGRAVYIPYETTWAHEIASEEELAGKEFVTLSHIREVPAAVGELR
jgi:putative hydrolase of the HAD superfamily